MAKRIRIIIVYTALLLTVSSTVHAKCDTCILYGKNHAFALTAPKGWVLDTSSGVAERRYQIFYPEGETWSKSPAIVYSRARQKDDRIQTIEEQVADTLADFQPSSPNIKVAYQETIKVQHGKEAHVYYFTGDQWGNFEAAAYIDEPKTINFVVLSARTKESFLASLGTFEELIKSYVFISDNVSIKDSAPTVTDVNLPSSLEEAISLGERQERGDKTKEFHNKTLMPYFASKYANVLKTCFKALQQPDDHKFTFVVAIGPSGEVLRVYRDDETNVFSCMNKDLIHEIFPAPPVAPYFMHIDMKFSK